MQAIQTVYKNYRFRSRLEARWAVFFDELGIKYMYEHEGYELGNGERYLPDFWLPTFNHHGMFAEVKPCAFTPQEMNKVCKLVIQSRKPVMLCVDVPDFSVINYLVYCDLSLYPTSEDNNEADLKKEMIIPIEYRRKITMLYGCPNADQANGEDRMFVFPGYEDSSGYINERDQKHCLGSWYCDAVFAAKSARFEYGETPTF